MWCWTNAHWVTFFYSPQGDSNSVRRFLGEDLCRTVQCDGTNLTTFIERAGGKRPGCWSHGRRRLVEAARAGDKLAMEGLKFQLGPSREQRDQCLLDDKRMRFAEVAAEKMPADASVAALAIGAIGWLRPKAYVLDACFLVSKESPRHYPWPYFPIAFEDTILRHEPDYVFTDTYWLPLTDKLRDDYRVVESMPNNCEEVGRTGDFQLWERVGPASETP
jgi:hypothetical protein